MCAPPLRLFRALRNRVADTGEDFGVGAIEIGQAPLAIADSEAMRQQRRTNPTALIRRIDADQRHEPMGFRGVIGAHLPENLEPCRFGGFRNTSFDEGGKSVVVWMFIGRQPQRGSGTLSGYMCTVVVKSLTAVQPDKLWEVGQILQLIRVEAAARRIVRESKRHEACDPEFVRPLCDSYSWRVHFAFSPG